MFLDGEASQAEIDDFGYIFNRIKLFKGMEVPDLSPTFQKLYEQFENDAKKVAETVIPFISKDKGLAVFSYCLEIIFADADIADEENAFVHYLIEAFSMDDTIAANAITLMSTRFTL